MALTVNHLRGTETPDAPSITLYAHLSDPRGTRSLLSYWWSIPTGGEGHSYEAPWPHANCMKCFLRSSLYIIPQLSTSLYPSGGHGQPSLALTGRKLILLLLLLLLLLLYIIPQLSTSLYPSGGHGQPSLAPTGRKLILLLLLLLLSI